jgi:hypothetical protein
MVIFDHQFCLFHIRGRFSGLEQFQKLFFLMFEHVKMVNSVQSG